jgi:type VI secretion system protein ImpA
MPLEVQSLLDPMASDAPCGVDLDGTQLMASFDGFRIWGQLDPEWERKIDWREVRNRSLQALERSRDLRLLAYLAAAVVRIDGLFTFSQLVQVAARWLEEHWDRVFPLVDEDALLRRNALNLFADRLAVVDAVRRATLLTHRQLGAITLRDVELASGKIVPTDKDANRPNLDQIKAAIKTLPVEQQDAMLNTVRNTTVALRNISDMMQRHGDVQSTPDFDPLLLPLLRLETMMTDIVAPASHQVTANGKANGGGPQAVSGPSLDNGVLAGKHSVRTGAITSRQEAICAIDAAAAFFRMHEPSSPVPLFLERARRLVDKSFMEVLQDIVPESLGQARLIGGVAEDRDAAQ